MLLWIFMYKFLWGNMFLFHIYIHIELCHVITLCCPFEKLPHRFPKWMHAFPFLQHYRRILISSHATNILYYTTLVNVKWHFDVILICISLMTNAIDHIFMYSLWLFVYLLLRNVCLYPLPNFNQFVCF